MTAAELKATLKGDDTDAARWQEWWKEQGTTYDTCINIGDRAIAKDFDDHWQVHIWVGEGMNPFPLYRSRSKSPARFDEEAAKAVALDYATQFPPLF